MRATYLLFVGRSARTTVRQAVAQQTTIPPAPLSPFVSLPADRSAAVA
jgi:hypothetical protein